MHFLSANLACKYLHILSLGDIVLIHLKCLCIIKTEGHMVSVHVAKNS